MSLQYGDTIKYDDRKYLVIGYVGPGNYQIVEITERLSHTPGLVTLAENKNANIRLLLQDEEVELYEDEDFFVGCRVKVIPSMSMKRNGIKDISVGYILQLYVDTDESTVSALVRIFMGNMEPIDRLVPIRSLHKDNVDGWSGSYEIENTINRSRSDKNLFAECSEGLSERNERRLLFPDNYRKVMWEGATEWVENHPPFNSYVRHASMEGMIGVIVPKHDGTHTVFENTEYRCIYFPGYYSGTSGWGVFNGSTNWSTRTLIVDYGCIIVPESEIRYGAK